MVPKRGLGRGLGALLSSSPTEGEALIEVSLDEITPNPNQPRKEFEPRGLEQLAASIRASGVLQPVIARKTAHGYELIAGERRWRAARQAGLGRIPVIVREATDAESLELALVENLLREDLNPIEEAEAYQKLLAQFNWTQEELSQKIGKDRSSIANTLRLLRLPNAIQDDLTAGRLTMGHARALLALTLPSEQLKLRNEILTHQWSVRATEEGVNLHRTVRAPRRRRSAELAAIEEALQRALMTRVTIVGHDRRGKIEITYATAEELERITSTLMAGRGL
jgi:ParB family transcriptional regulator, chromosome partitioning protein